MYIIFVSFIFSLVITSGYFLKNKDCECDNDMLGDSPPSFFEVSAGIKESYVARIVRGNITRIEDHPHHAFITTDGYTNVDTYCGGSIISSMWILTAGHCRGQYMTAIVGSSVLNEGKRYNVKKTFLFPKYLKVDGKSHYDYLLLKLQKHLHFDSTVQPIQLGSRSYIINGVMANVTGFGRTSENSLPSKRLRVVEVPIINYRHCRSWREDLHIQEFCAGYEKGGISTCKGDSGGGLVVSGKLIGVVSHQRGCARYHKPTVYSGVPYATKWICRVTRICPNDDQQDSSHYMSLHIDWK